jgi:integrase
MAVRFTRLTRKAIRSLQPGQKLTERGITAECLANGDTKYSVGIMVDHQRIHRTIGRESDGTTRSQCEDFIATTHADAKSGRLNLPKGRKSHPTFRKAASDYLDRLEETGGKNIAAKRQQLELTLVPFFADQQLRTNSTFTVDRYKKQHAAAGASNGTINRHLATLSHLLNKAIEWKWISSHPCKITKLKEDAGRIIALTDEESGALVEASIADADTYCWLFVMFGLNTAMRHSEILRARFDKIDNLRLRIPKAKSGAREQPITPQLAEILRREQEQADDPRGWIFPTLRPSVSPNGHRTRMDRPFRRAVIRAGLDPALVTPHVMRHTAITNLVKAGVDLPTIQRISGHKTLAMVMRYTHVHGTHIDQAISAIGRGIPERAENKTAGTVTHRLHTLKKARRESGRK